MGPDDLKPAPEPLRLLQRFVNTRSLMRDVDLLSSSNRFAAWLDGLGYGALESELDEVEREHLLTLREALRALLQGHTPGMAPVTEQATGQIDQLLGDEVLNVAFSSTGEPRLVAHSTGVRGFGEEVLATAIWAQHAGVWERLKVCANADCRWVFYDSSKNRSGSWCDMDMCGSRAKMRTYRAKTG